MLYNVQVHIRAWLILLHLRWAMNTHTHTHSSVVLYRNFHLFQVIYTQCCCNALYPPGSTNTFVLLSMYNKAKVCGHPGITEAVICCCHSFTLDEARALCGFSSQKPFPLWRHTFHTVKLDPPNPRIMSG